MNPQMLVAICTRYGIGDVPVIEALMDPIIAYDGITIKEGFACHMCGHVGGTKNSITDHYNKKHGSREAKSYTLCSYQQLCGKDTHKTKFQVHPKVIPPPPTTLESMMNDVREAATLLGKPDESTVNARAISPWLLASGFHSHTEGHDMSALMALTAGGNDPKTLKLKKVVRMYFHHATKLLLSTDTLVKQILNSPDPLKS